MEELLEPLRNRVLTEFLTPDEYRSHGRTKRCRREDWPGLGLKRGNNRKVAGKTRIGLRLRLKLKEKHSIGISTALSSGLVLNSSKVQSPESCGKRDWRGFEER